MLKEDTDCVDAFVRIIFGKTGNNKAVESSPHNTVYEYLACEIMPNAPLRFQCDTILPLMMAATRESKRVAIVAEMLPNTVRKKVLPGFPVTGR